MLRISLVTTLLGVVAPSCFYSPNSAQLLSSITVCLSSFNLMPMLWNKVSRMVVHFALRF